MITRLCDASVIPAKAIVPKLAIFGLDSHLMTIGTLAASKFLLRIIVVLTRNVACMSTSRMPMSDHWNRCQWYFAAPRLVIGANSCKWYLWGFTIDVSDTWSDAMSSLKLFLNVSSMATILAEKRCGARAKRQWIRWIVWNRDQPICEDWQHSKRSSHSSEMVDGNHRAMVSWSDRSVQCRLNRATGPSWCVLLSLLKWSRHWNSWSLFWFFCGYWQSVRIR